MRRFAFFALGATALCAVAFSPGPDLALALIIVALTVAFVVLAVPWLKSTFLTSSATWGWIGHGHVHSQAGGLGAGGRHGPPRSIFMLMLVVLTALMTKTLHLLSMFSAGRSMASTNTSAQPLPS